MTECVQYEMREIKLLVLSDISQLPDLSVDLRIIGDLIPNCVWHTMK